MGDAAETPKHMDCDEVRRDRLLVIVGQTAVGKTEMALRLAERLPIEVISADSRQVYRLMDIGTAKPAPAQLAEVRHHLIDVVDPDDEFSLAEFVSAAKTAIENANLTGKLPVLVGGTGQYVMAVLEGWNVPTVPPNPELRRTLDDLMRSDGLPPLVERLRRLDPVALQTVDIKNPRRVIRAIELAVAGHRRAERRAPNRKPAFDSLVVGLHMERPDLYRRIDDRVERMISQGFVEEVEMLLDSGYDRTLPSMSGIGYRELADYLANRSDLEHAVSRTKFRTHRYARQQSSWFRRDDPRIEWSEVSEMDSALEVAHTWASARGRHISN